MGLDLEERDQQMKNTSRTTKAKQKKKYNIYIYIKGTTIAQMLKALAAQLDPVSQSYTHKEKEKEKEKERESMQRSRHEMRETYISASLRRCEQLSRSSRPRPSGSSPGIELGLGSRSLGKSDRSTDQTNSRSINQSINQ